MRDPYARLAPLYDGMARDPGIACFYRRWRQSLLEEAKRRGLTGGVVVDLACGTGNSTIPWAGRRGWKVIGVDRSAAMLRVARAKSSAVRWVRQDLLRLDLGVRATLVTCQFDSLNHLLDARDLERVFSRVAHLLEPGGLFQFDLNTVHMLRWLHLREKLFQVRPHWFTASNAYDEKSGIATFQQHWFVRQAAAEPAAAGRRRHPRPARFERILVSVQERSFADAAVRAMLARQGLRLARVDIQVKIDGKPMRKLYLAVKPQAR
jgi:ubiquinone/menaquinone biosynthesis C-methylase UbiE